MDKLPPFPGNVIPPVPPSSRQPAPAPPAPAKRSRRRRMLVTASTVAVLLGAVVLVRYQSAPLDDAEEPVDRLEQTADVAANAEPVPAAPALHSVPVASAGIGGAPVVEERPAAPVVIVPPRKKTILTTPATKHVAASAKTTTAKPTEKTVGKSTAKPAWPIAPPTVASAPAKADTVATHVQASTESVGPAPVTLTGCLEMTVSRDEFRLSDTDGAYAPRARSWRTGFLTKRATPVALVDAPDPYGLQRQVGKRVAATGQLIDHEMKVSSVRVVGSSCE